MRIVLIHRYFWPDTPPYAHILRDVALSLGDAGHEVTVLTCQPSYNRAVSGRAPRREALSPQVRVRRWPVLPDRSSSVAKGLNLGWFCLRLLAAGLVLSKVDSVMAASSPPVAVAKTASWLARMRRASFVYHKQDIYPEVALAPGIARQGVLTTLLRRCDAATDRAAAQVVVLSADMAATETSRGVRQDHLRVINNFDPWALPATGPDDADGRRAEPGHSHAETLDMRSVNVVFAGNLGRFQNLETVFTAVSALGDQSDVAFHFFGNGALLDRLRALVSEDDLANVVVHGYQPPHVVADFLRDEADLGIVSLAPGVIRAAYPSKTMSYLRQGCALLVLVEADSELAREVVAADAGMQVDPTDDVGLATLLRGLPRQRTELEKMGANALALYAAQFGKERQLAHWLDLFGSLDTAGTRAPC